MKRTDIPDRYEFTQLYPAAEKPEDHWVNVGNSVIVAAGGRILAGPIACEEKIIYAEIDPSWGRGSKFSLDVAGHYARPDVFQLIVNREPNRMILATGEQPPSINGKTTPEPRRRRRELGTK